MATSRGASTLTARLLTLLCLWGCGHSARTETMRHALDAGDLRGAIGSLNQELGVKSDRELPKKMDDDALLVLDRASLQQARGQFRLSQRDFETADKAIDRLDIQHSTADDIGKYMFSDSSGRYRAPAYEKLMINTLNMMNYLEQRDLSGALVEARRLAVTQRYYRDGRSEGDSAILGLAGFLAGLAYEKSGQYDEALRYYDDALAVHDLHGLDSTIRRLFAKSSYRSPRLEAHAARAPEIEDDEHAEIITVIGYGRVPHKVAYRLPIGLALTRFSYALRPDDVNAANRLAAQGLVTWINFPGLARAREPMEFPVVRIDGKPVPVEDAVSVTSEVRREWQRIEGAVVGSAITRLITRYASGAIAGAVVDGMSKQSGLGALVSLAVQGGLAAADVPDTRSWETLPARVAVVRTRVPAGRHTLALSARGVSRTQTVELPARSWLFVSMQALR